MTYKYWMLIVGPSMNERYIKSDSLTFLIDLGKTGLECGEYTSATIKEM